MINIEKRLPVVIEKMFGMYIFEFHRCKCTRGYAKMREAIKIIRQQIKLYKYLRIYQSSAIILALRLLGDYNKICEIGKVVTAKNADYGAHNLKYFGKFGIIVRINDKINRLENLQKNAPQTHESSQDTLDDLIGYLLLSLCYT